MRRYIIIGVFTLIAHTALPQGSIQFNNRVTGTTTSAVVAPVFDLDSLSPYEHKNGAPAQPVPPGFPQTGQVYRGGPLVGSGYTASLWARRAGTTDPFVQAATTPFRTTTSTSLFGFWTVPGTAAVLSNVPSDPTAFADIVVRVWNNEGGTITRWDQLYDPVTGGVIAANAQVPRGESLMFTTVNQLGGGTVLPPTLVGLQSFQLYIEQVPEPSTLAFLALLAFPFLYLRRKS